MKKVKLTPLFHRGKQQIAIRFSYDKAIKAHLKKLDIVKWSQTHKTFYATKSQQSTAIV